MNRTLILTLFLGLGVAVGVSATLSKAPQSGGDLAAPPTSPQRSLVTVLEAHPFQLSSPETHWMRAEAEAYDSGMLLVLEADAELLIPRQGYENVLYVGAETAEPLNVGQLSGHRVVIVPGDVNLAEAPIFFGEPELPERVTRAEAQRQLGLAVDAGARAQASVAVEPAQTFADGYELRLFAADLIERYAPDEVDVVSGYRVERL